MHRSIPLLAALLGATTGAALADDEPPLGVRPDTWPTLRAAEDRARAVPLPSKARAWLKTLTEEPHVAGTPADRETAEFVRDRLQEWGWDAEIAEYEVLLNYPQPESVALEIVRPEPRKLPVREEPHLPDKDSASPDAWPAFHGYGISGDVTGQVVYANYGTPEDFRKLDEMGVEVKGKIALVRYAGLFRGLKVLNAHRAGAIGVLIYSDPADDGYMKGDVYPRGPYRPASAIQRGSVQFLSHGPGDPSTPGWPSVKDAERLPIDPANGFPIPEFLLRSSGGGGNLIVPKMDPAAWEKQTGLKRADYFASIPSLPISYEAAKPILEALGGDNVPSGWQGALPFAYHTGPGPVEVRFAIMMDYQIRPIWNVIGTIKGEQEPDRWVLIGNHRDAWAYGAVDPGSGTAATLEMCRAIGEAVKSGWKPRRTLRYASWDAEEYGLVGSTEWAEHHAEDLDQKAALLLNVDSAVAGPTLDLDGSPSLRDLILESAGAVLDPRTGKTLRDGWLSKRRGAWASSVALDPGEDLWEGDADPASVLARRPSRSFSPKLNDLGSGSDYTAFLDHLGIPAADVNFTGAYGVYHSIYDDFYWMEQFGDPGFHLHALSARLYTTIALRAAGSDILPLTFTPYGEALRTHVDDLRQRLTRRALSDSSPSIGPERLAELVVAVRAFRVAAHEADAATSALARRDDVNEETLQAVNDALTRVERAFLAPEGLPGRPWFRHTIYAPGLTLGYGAWPLPGLRQAIEARDSKLFDAQRTLLVSRIEAATRALRAVIEAAGPPDDPEE